MPVRYLKVSSHGDAHAIMTISKHVASWEWPRARNRHRENLPYRYFYRNVSALKIISIQISVRYLSDNLIVSGEANNNT